MEVIFLIGAIQAIFLAILVFTKKNKMLADKVLIFWLGLTSFHLFSYYLHSTGAIYDYPNLNGVSLFLPIMEGVLMYIYVKVITQKKQRIKPIYFLHTLPYLAFTTAVFIEVYTDPNPIKAVVVDCLKEDTPQYIQAMTSFNSFLGPIYIIACLVLLKKHDRNIFKNFSYTEDIDLKWLKYLISSMAMVWLVVVVVNVFSENLQFITRELANDLIYYTVTVAIFFEGYFGIKQQVIYKPNTNKITKPEIQVNTIIPNVQEQKRYKKSGLKKQDSQLHLERLLSFMEKEQPYTNGKLSLKQVASELEISTNHLSQVINENLNKNFFDFVNEYRVDMVKEKMADPKQQQYTLLALAYECGFNSKSSFNSIFKKYTGVTPTAYQKNNL